MLVFVHGFNTPFDEARDRAAQIVADSRFGGVAVLFTWPTKHELFGYVSDKDNATASRDALQSLLQEIGATPGVGKVHVLAHSMGGWLAMEALRQEAIAGDRDLSGHLGEVMLASPDIDMDVFAGQMARLRPASVTVFATANDRALSLSSAIAQSRQRVGAINPSKPEDRERLEALGAKVYDLTNFSDGFIDHGAYADAPDVLHAIGAQMATPRPQDANTMSSIDASGYVDPSAGAADSRVRLRRPLRRPRRGRLRPPQRQFPAATPQAAALPARGDRELSGPPQAPLLPSHAAPPHIQTRDLRSPAMPSKLDQLRTMTTIVADTGDMESIRAYQPTDSTTNPTLIYKAAQLPAYGYLFDEAVGWGRKTGASPAAVTERLIIDFGAELTRIVPGRVSTEVDATLSFDVAGTIAKAREIIAAYAERGIGRDRILIKIASTWEGAQAAATLQREGVDCNMTLLFSLAQAVAAADAGAFLISPFVGRIFDWHVKAGGGPYTGDTDPGVSRSSRSTPTTRPTESRRS